MLSKISPDTMDRSLGATTEGAVGRGALAEDSPAYEAVKKAGVLCFDYRRADIADIFTGLDFSANSSKDKNLAVSFSFME